MSEIEGLVLRAEQEMLAGRFGGGPTIGSSALLAEDALGQFLPEPLVLFRIGGSLETASEDQEALPLRLSRMKPSLDEVDEDTIGADIPCLGQHTDALRYHRR